MTFCKCRRCGCSSPLYCREHGGRHTTSGLCAVGHTDGHACCGSRAAEPRESEGPEGTS